MVVVVIETGHVMTLPLSVVVFVVAAGDSGSVVRGNLAHGVFDGVMKTQGVVYHIEPASR